MPAEQAQLMDQMNQEREAQERRQRMERAQAARLPYNFGGTQSPLPFMAFAGAAMAPGMAAHSSAISQVNNAISQEMQSRVAQQREARRMQHEKDMLSMRMQAGGGQESGGLDRGTVIRELLARMRG
jgi:hypothetical protein